MKTTIRLKYNAVHRETIEGSILQGQGDFVATLRVLNNMQLFSSEGVVGTESCLSVQFKIDNWLPS